MVYIVLFQECLMAIRDCLVRHTDIILEKSKPLTLEMPKDMRESLGGRVRELLLQVYKLGFEVSCSVVHAA